MTIRAMIGPQCGRSARRERVSALTLVAAALFAALTALASAKAEEPSKCAASPHLLWGDGFVFPGLFDHQGSGMNRAFGMDSNVAGGLALATRRTMWSYWLGAPY